MLFVDIKRRITSIALTLFCAIFLFFVPVVVDAQGLINTGDCQGIPGTTDSGCRNVEILLIQAIHVIEYLFGILGTLAFVMFIYGGVQMIFSFGSEEKFKEGRAAMVNAVVGMFIAFSAYILVNFTLDVLNVNQDFRAIGSENDQPVSGECSTNSDCNGAGTNPQLVCQESQCVNVCGDAGGTCGAWTASSCAGTIRTGLCPNDESWVCCVSSSSLDTP
jgi:hypothetical protein